MTVEYKKIEFKEFEDLKNKVKFINYYWMRYSSQHPKQDYSEEIIDVLELIEDFIYQNRYEELREVKINFRRTKIKLSGNNFRKLKKYAAISVLLKNSIEETTIQ